MIYQQALSIATSKRGAYEITQQIQAVVKASNFEAGLCNIYIQHTSASLIVCENADSSVLDDLEFYFSNIVPDGSQTYSHSAEGPDDMPAHIRTILTQVSLTIPIAQRRLLLGTWQGIFIYEHRYIAHTRNMMVTIQA